MSLVMGLDSGGTKTIMAFADRQGNVTSMQHAKGLDPSAGDGWVDALRDLVGFNPYNMQRTKASVLGLPYYGELSAFSRAQRSIVQELIPNKSLILNDVRVAFDGAFANKSGVLVLAGTGSMAWASTNEHNAPHIRVGGWGDAFGDEGSAFWIGREALGIVSHDLDGREASLPFREAILSALKLEPDELMGWCYGLENKRVGIASLAFNVSDLAIIGDTTAIEILHRSAKHLANHAQVAWAQTNSQNPMVWSYAGGVFSNQIVLKRVTALMGCDPTPPRLAPIGGAILHAAKLAGWSIDEHWLDRLAASLFEMISAERDSIPVIED